MKENAANDVKEIKRNGISVRIRPTIKDGTTYFVADYRVQGQRKLVWRSTLAKAREAANAAIDKITEGQSEVLNLKSVDAHAYTRARDWLKRHAVALPKITVADAVAQLKQQAESDGKSNARRKQLAAGLDAFALSFNYDVQELTPKLVADYLTGLNFRERTKRNHWDTIGFFNRWLVLRGYLAKGTDWLEGVQHYSARKQGEIVLYSVEEMRRLITAADNRILPMIL